MYTVEQVAAILGVDGSSVRRIILEGKLDATRIGKRLLVITPEALAAYQARPREGRMGRPRKGVKVAAK